MLVTAFWTALSVPKPQDILSTLISEGFVPDKKKNWRKGSETPISFLTHIEWFCWLKGGCWESSSACWALHKLSAKYHQAGLLLKKTLSGGTSRCYISTFKWPYTTCLHVKYSSFASYVDPGDVNKKHLELEMNLFFCFQLCFMTGEFYFSRRKRSHQIKNRTQLQCL